MEKKNGETEQAEKRIRETNSIEINVYMNDCFGIGYNQTKYEDWTIKKYDIIIVSGSRTIINRKLVFDILSDFHTEKIYVGDAEGVDKSTFVYARKNKINKEIFKPDWKRYIEKHHGNPAGKIRTSEMIEKANKESKNIYGVCLIENNSRGTTHAINTFSRLKIKHTIFNIKDGKLIYTEKSK